MEKYDKLFHNLFGQNGAYLNIIFLKGNRTYRHFQFRRIKNYASFVRQFSLENKSSMETLLNSKFLFLGKSTSTPKISSVHTEHSHP